MWGVFLPIYINQPLGQSTPKLPYGEPLVWEIPRVVNYIFPSSLAVAAARRRRSYQDMVSTCPRTISVMFYSYINPIFSLQLLFVTWQTYLVYLLCLTGLCPQACSPVLQDSNRANQLLYIAVSLSLDACWCFNTAIKLASHSVHVHVWCTHKQARSHLSTVLILQIFCCPEPVHQRLHWDISSRLLAD